MVEFCCLGFIIIAVIVGLETKDACLERIIINFKRNVPK